MRKRGNENVRQRATLIEFCQLCRSDCIESDRSVIVLSLSLSLPLFISLSSISWSLSDCQLGTFVIYHHSLACSAYFTLHILLLLLLPTSSLNLCDLCLFLFLSPSLYSTLFFPFFVVHLLSAFHC